MTAVGRAPLLLGDLFGKISSDFVRTTEMHAGYKNNEQKVGDFGRISKGCFK